LLVYPTNDTLARVAAKQPQPQPALSRVRERATWLISRAYVRSNGLLNDGFAADGAGLRGYHYRLLAALDETGPASQADLARGTGIDRSDVVAVLGELEARRLVTRAVDQNNRRRNIVSITAAGRKRLAALDRVVDDVQERVLAPLSQTERRQLTRLLQKLGLEND
jgi:DNA-binding MarR family transcriptional regulator